MATKLKNFPYNPVTKFFMILLSVAAVAVGVFSLVSVFTSNGEFGESHYYGTRDFYYDYGRLAHNALEKHLVLIDEKTILESDKEDNEKNADIRRIRTIDENLDNATGFLFVLENKVDGHVVTNLDKVDPVGYIQTRESSLLYEYDDVYVPEGSILNEVTNRYYTSGSYQYYSHMSSEILHILNEINTDENADWRFYIATMNVIPEDDLFFYQDRRDFEWFKQYEDWLITGMTAGGVVLLFVLLYFLFTVGKSSSTEKTKLLPYDEIPHELQSLITAALVAPFAGYMSMWDSGNIGMEKALQITLFIVFVEIFYIGFLVQYLSLVRLLKARSFWKKTAVGRLFIYLISLIRLPKFDKRYRWRFTLWILGWLILNGIGFAILFSAPPLGFLVLPVINFVAFNRFFKLLDDLKGLMDTIHNRRMGIHTDKIDPSRISDSLVTFAEDLEALKEGLDVALEDRIKGEKLKTELITNVTHDLKNPLTSIISYVELLKTKDIYDDETRKYIEVLDEKAGRLKLLIEQLVDASKASSGNVEINMTTVDMVQMTRQLCGEFSDKLEAAKLNCVMPDFKQAHYAEADPMVLYRILENLMSNVCKYSMEGTRVYVSVDEKDGEVRYAIKNISSEPLNMGVEDISQRFVRGDSSRNTEGSGLGISIALSLAKLIGARLELEIDGDLFKATLVLKKGTAPVVLHEQEDISDVVTEPVVKTITDIKTDVVESEPSLSADEE